MRNMSLEREITDLQRRVDELKKEREGLYGYFGDQLLGD